MQPRRVRLEVVELLGTAFLVEAHTLSHFGVSASRFPHGGPGQPGHIVRPVALTPRTSVPDVPVRAAQQSEVLHATDATPSHSAADCQRRVHNVSFTRKSRSKHVDAASGTHTTSRRPGRSEA